ncbi:hypothetical protein DRW03_28955 [Corallococcus sp. H22C18031201]|nr:hypothetical protein DRW03_28955 [Corallococcus sp. H22C18031201]
MRPSFLTSALLLLASCSATTESHPSPSTRFVYPSGLEFWRPAGSLPPSTNGYLFVASANFDSCFDSGAVMAVNLDSIGQGQGKPLPTLDPAQPFSGTPLEITELNVPSEAYVQIDSFAGEMASWSNPGNGGLPRLFVPSRAKNNFLHAIDFKLDGGTGALACAQSGAGRDCAQNALSLTSDIPHSAADLPRAPSPIGVTVDPASGSVYVTHSEAADSPARTSKNFANYLVSVPADNPVRDNLEFILLSRDGLTYGGTDATAVGDGYLYVTGRNYVQGSSGTVGASFILRLVDKFDHTHVIEPNVFSQVRISEARGAQVVRAPVDPAAPLVRKERLYMLARGPDTLLVFDFEYKLPDPALGEVRPSTPSFRIVSTVPMPGGTSELRLVRRSKDSVGDNIIAVTSTTDGALSLYDEKLGQVVAQVALGTGLNQNTNPTQSFGLAVDNPDGELAAGAAGRINAARVFVTNFGAGQVTVVDIPDLNRPQDARLVARIGTRQERDLRQGTSVCEENNP